MVKKTDKRKIGEIEEDDDGGGAQDAGGAGARQSLSLNRAEESPKPPVSKESTLPGPDMPTEFINVMLDKGVPMQVAERATKHILTVGSPTVFSNVPELLTLLINFPRDIPPLTRKLIVDHWIAINKLDVPDNYEQIAGADSQSVRRAAEQERQAESSKEEKYSVNETTGDIRPASSSDTKPLSRSEAEWLSTKIKTDIKARQAESGGKKDAEEPHIIVDEDGNFKLNPKAKLTVMDAYLIETMNQAKSRGEMQDPIEYLAKKRQEMELLMGKPNDQGSALSRAEELKVLKEVFGGDKEGMTLILAEIRNLATTIAQGGTNKGDNPEVAVLREEINRMREDQNREREANQLERERLRDDLHKKELEEQAKEAHRLEEMVTSLRGDVALARQQGVVSNEYGIMKEAIDGVKQMGKDIKETVMSVVAKAPSPLSKKTKEDLTEGIKQKAIEDSEIDELMQGIYGKTP